MKVKAPSPLGLIDNRLRPALTPNIELLDYLQQLARLPLFYLLPSVLRSNLSAEDPSPSTGEDPSRTGGKHTHID